MAAPVLAASLDTAPRGLVAAAASWWADIPLWGFVVGGAGLAAAALIGLYFVWRSAADIGEPADEPVDEPLSDGRPPEPKVFVLGFLGDDGGARTRIAAVLSAALGDRVAVTRGGPLGGRDDQDADTELKRARAVLANTRAALAIWGEADGAHLTIKLLGHGQPGFEAYGAPADLARPYDAALAGVAGAILRETPLEGPTGALDWSDVLDRARVELNAVLSGAPTMAREPDAEDVICLNALRARVAFALHEVTGNATDLTIALKSARAGDRDQRRIAPPLARAEAKALRARLAEIFLARKPEPDPHLLREQIMALRGATAIWRKAGARARALRAQGATARGLLALADRTGDTQWLGEAETLADAAAAAFGAGAGALAARRVGVRGAIRLRLGEAEPRTTRLEAAEADLGRAARLAADAGDAALAATYRVDHARAVARLGERDPDSARLRAAAALYRAALDAEELSALQAARARAGLGACLHQVGERERDREAADEAAIALHAAVHALEGLGWNAAAAKARRELERAERLLAELRMARPREEA